MKGSINAFNNLPWPLKVATLVVGGSGILSLIYYFISPQYLYVLLIGLFVVGLLLLTYRSFLVWQSKRKAAPLEQGLVSNSTATPQGISDPNRVADLDDLRKKFSEGVQKFRDAGKNIYSLPWYLLVGEPGSGKTEAIRHSKVRFPPGLQNELQGAGGTVNMNWWFTVKGVILDTAGRLMFEEIKPGGTSEWDEFLKLLRKNRPNCPVNGMLLVIPADSIIKDNANEIDRKGSKIAQQLHHIQRVLGVRFPVFVVITKCDLINGFREFFNPLTDPDLQDQILGWSNPGKLDEPFDSDLVEKHLQQIKEKLMRRRLGLLLDPVPTDQPSRTDEVDALYAFPDSLVQISGRLKRYLETIFVEGEWSQKPLFLRGIYFTSAMREGSALDAELAEVLNVPVEQLPEGKVWQKDRSFFLLDLFRKKVFVEKGLVTRASNTRQLQTQRKAAVMGAGIISAVVLLLFTWFGSSQLEESIGGQRKFWNSVSHEFREGYLKIAGRDYSGAVFKYYGGGKMEWEGYPDLTVGRFPVVAMEMAKQPIIVPWIFKPVLWFTPMEGNYDAKRHAALSAILQRFYFRPVITESAQKIIDATADQWALPATDALTQLVRLEAQSEDALPVIKEDSLTELAFDFDSLMRFTLHHGDATVDNESEQEDNTSYPWYDLNDREGINETINWLYTPAGAGHVWPAADLLAATGVSRDIERGIDTFNASWAQRYDMNRPESYLAQLRTLLDTLAELTNHESKLIRISEGYESDEPTTQAEYDQASQRWAQRLAVAAEARQAVDAATAAVGQDLLDRGVEAVTQDATQKVLDIALARYTQLLNATGDKPGLGSALEAIGVDDQAKEALALAPPASPALEIRQTLKDAKTKLEQEVKQTLHVLNTELSRYESDFLVKPTGSQDRAYAVRFGMYEAADGYLHEEYKLDQFPNVPEAIERIDSSYGEKVAQVNFRRRQKPDSDRFKEGAAASRFVLRMAQRRHLYDILDRAYIEVKDSSERFRGMVASIVKDDHGLFQPWERPSITATESETMRHFQDDFHPEAAEKLFEAWDEIQDQLGRQRDGSPVVLELDALKANYESAKDGLDAYVGDYLEYWTVKARNEATVNHKSFGTWRTFVSEIKSINANLTNGQIDSNIDMILDAIDHVPPAVMSEELVVKAEKAKTALRKEKGEINRRFDRLCEDSIRAWMSLGGSEADAIKLMRSLTPRDFEHDYFAPYSDDRENPGVQYWNDLCLEAVRLLSEAAWRRTKEAVNKIINDYQAFPLCLTRVRSRVLTPEEVDQASSSLAHVGTVGEPETIGGGAKTRFEAVNTHLMKVTGQDVLPSHQQKWLNRLKEVCDALRADPPLSCRLVILKWEDQTSMDAPRTADDLKPGYTEYRYLQLYRGDDPFADPVNSDKTGQTENFPVPLDDWGDDEEDLSIRFFRHEDDLNTKQAGAVMTLASPWTVLDLIHDSDAKRQDDPKRWIVPMVFEDQDPDRKDKYYYWVVLEFNRPIPTAEDWPNEGNWPREK